MGTDSRLNRLARRLSFVLAPQRAKMSPVLHQLNLLDRFAIAFFPSWGQSRVKARIATEGLVRHYEAAARGRRTSGWSRGGTDANAAAGTSIAALRELARDLVRNNSWARNGLRTITTNTVGWGIVARAASAHAKLAAAWRLWSEKQCDADGRLSLAGIQSLAMRSVVEAGEVLIRRRWRRASDGLAIPMQLQVLEADFIDTSVDGVLGSPGTTTVQGVEFDALGRRAAYWLFDKHPGASGPGLAISKRVPASEILHLFFAERPGQVRGTSWLGSVIVNLKDFDEYEDASLMKAKIAAVFAAFVTDVDGAGSALGETTEDQPLVETLEPGQISYLRPGQSVEFGTPPVNASDGFSERQLRRVAAGLGVTFEDLTGDYSQVNFSSARMSRIKHWSNVHDWRWQMLIPQLCAGIWEWAMEAATVAGLTETTPTAEWTPPPMPMIEPDREGLALQRLVRTGAMTIDEMVRERGFDPETHWAEYAEGLKRLDSLGIVLDCDARKTNQSGQVQSGGPSAALPAPAQEQKSPGARNEAGSVSQRERT